MLRKMARGAPLPGASARGVLPTAAAAVRTGVVLVLLAVFAAAPVQARRPAFEPSSQDSPKTISSVELPPEGRETYRLIRLGGPFPYEKDGVVFGNRERLLPSRARGYYHEYTVAAPRRGSRSGGRGAQRIVCGGVPRTPDRCYYTDDHYASFKEIRE